MDEQGNKSQEAQQDTLARTYYQHKQHGGLYEARTEADGRINIWPQGGGFSGMLSAEEFAAQFEVAPPPVMRRGTVTADFLDDGQVFSCYSDGSRWNGWGMPLFDKDTALKVAEAIPGITFNEATGVFVVQFEGEEPEEHHPQTIVCDGQPVVVYQIGGGWTWDQVVFPDSSDAATNEGK
ncbi:hypothetical protein [Noviherbaspirillum pedocola]|uniref:Uncharacterized protein n=1 Tax=Noviherbaspirillum pedocola TaxID=2801341 RepID=A0A934W9C6_9BURK|nr:hypothetical protein [Noviherbaspirillum pedocola]MBK4737923.1 hypothetical protein [Noviherbaspirillum pedocola]